MVNDGNRCKAATKLMISIQGDTATVPNMFAWLDRYPDSPTMRQAMTTANPKADNA